MTYAAITQYGMIASILLMEVSHEKGVNGSDDCLGGGILFGLGFVLAPEQLCSMFGFEQAPTYVPYFLGLLGIAYILGGVFVIIAVRDPLKHIMWVQLAIAWSLFDALSALYFIIRGNVNFSQAGMVPIMDVIFVVAFLVFYPWRKAPVG